MKRNKQVKPKALNSHALKDRVLTLLQKNPKERWNIAKIIKVLRVTNSKDSIGHALEALSADGRIKEVKDGYYKLADLKHITTYKGILDMTMSGSGYVVCEDMEDDVYIPRNRLSGALNGDEVEIVLRSKSRGKSEGEVVRILNRSREFFIGAYQQNKGFAFVIPTDRKVSLDFYVHPKDSLSAKDGDMVIVKVENWGDGSNKSPIARVTTILTDLEPHEFNMQSILVSQGFFEGFPRAVAMEADELPKTITEEDIAERRDMREVATFTIDPDTAKDFDDALSVRYLDENKIEIGIHIADVSHYVRPGTKLDKEAFSRSTSVYLVDRVAPMLPEVLSNELCSLRPNEESLTFSAVFVFDKNYGLVDEWFGKAVIFSDRRFTYEQAQELIEQPSAGQPLKNELDTLNEAYKILRERRFKEGAIDFESEELKIILDENKKPIKIIPKQRLDTHMLVEEFMLLANRRVAEYVYKKETPEIPFVYRIHDAPDQDRLTEFSLFLKSLGFQFKMDTPGAIRDSLNRLAKDAKTNDLLKLVQPMAVRVMSKAIYSTQSIGHFGLAFQYYTHFTSPIRRYSDVLVHRILFDNLDSTKRYDKADLEEKCLHISMQEKKAMDAERESIKYKQVEFMGDYIGQEFEAVISGIIERGIFVKIIENNCEGLVDFSSLGESYQLAPNRLTAVGNISKQEFKLGDGVRVRVIDTDLDLRQINFELVENVPLF